MRRSAKHLVGVWVEIGDFNHGMIGDETPAQFRSLNWTGITRGKKFEFAMIGVSYAYVMEPHAYGSNGAELQRMDANHKGSVQFSAHDSGDGDEAVYTCRLTWRGKPACIGGNSGSEFRRMNVTDSQLFGVFRP